MWQLEDWILQAFPLVSLVNVLTQFNYVTGRIVPLCERTFFCVVDGNVL